MRRYIIFFSTRLQTYILNLDKPPVERWHHIVQPYQEQVRLQIKVVLALCV